MAQSERVTCTCGHSVNWINWNNHLLRKDGKRHEEVVMQINPKDVEHFKAQIAAIPMTIEQKIANYVWGILREVGEDPERDGIRQTPERVARMYLTELLAGYKVDVAAIVKTFENDGYDQIVVVKDIPFYSLCEHHMLPFKGVAHIGYLPNGKVLGLSKFARIVDALASRLQIQERMTKQIADVIQNGLKPKGVCVVLSAEHLCLTMRGVQKPNSMMLTSMVTGIFLKDPSTKDEFFKLIGLGR